MFYGGSEEGSTRSSTTVIEQNKMPTGLVRDPEGVETRKQMLARRRKECNAEEVDVALAPVVKIPVPYVFYPDQYKRFRAMFPRVSVDSGLSFVHHDHPVAHTATLLGIRHMQSMLKPGEIALDIHGNPGGNERYNNFQSARVRKRPHLPSPPIIETMVEHRSAADAVRAVTKWGPEFDEYGVRRHFAGSISGITPGMYDTFLSVHTLYYYSMHQVCELLNKGANKGKRMVALVNYAKEQQGKLYGELEFSKSGGMTHQVSPNGESYSHPDIDPWFTHSSYKPVLDAQMGGISWTTHNIGGPLYIVTITACDDRLAKRVVYNPPGAPTLKVQKDGTFMGFVSVAGKDVQLQISNPDLAMELRHFMVFKDRSDPDVFESLVLKAKRATGQDYVSGVKQFECSAGHLQDHIVYAYLVDAPGDLELMQGVRVLRGDLLKPLSEALKFEGEVNKVGLAEALGRYFLGAKPTVKPALGARSKYKTVRAVPGNTGGLLPIQRA